MEKKGKMRRYQKKWVIVKNGWILWNDKRLKIDNAEDPEQRKHFKHSVNLLDLNDEFGI